MEEKTILLVLVGILIIGSFGVAQQASAFHFFDHFIELHWDFLLVDPFTIPLDTSLAPTSSASGGSIFSLSGTPGSATLFCSSSSGICTIVMPNYVDDLDFKFIEIEIEFGETGPVAPLSGTVGVSGSDAEDGPISCDPPTVFDSSPTKFISIFCFPNPDSETITIPFSPSDVATISAIWIETESFDDFGVGGTLIPIDTTSLIIAGAQTTTPWMIFGVIATVGIGLAVFTLKRNH